ncbi:unnamed protein product [Lathyrus sativus]|nr:unnamed protein product [Lathyrus sativus]
MIISWNVRGLNKKDKIRDISSRLLELNPNIAILLETIVKKDSVAHIRKLLNFKGVFADNYENHGNGRIWLAWKHNCIDIKLVCSTSQLVHCGVYDLVGNFMFWLTVIYAMNTLEQSRLLWKDLARIHSQQRGAWCLISDLNNVIKTQDGIGGRIVTEAEYNDLVTMMQNVGLYEMDSLDDYYT